MGYSQTKRGLENTEYEPEQFPGLVYRPSDDSCVILLFANGRVVIAGSPDVDVAQQSFESLKDRVADLLDTD